MPVDFLQTSRQCSLEREKPSNTGLRSAAQPDLAAGTTLHALTGHADWVTSVAVTADGTRAVTGSRDATTRIWELATGTTLHALTGHADWVYAVALTADGGRAVTASLDHTARVWDLTTGTTIHGRAHDVFAVAVTLEGTQAVTASADGTARVWDLATGITIHTLQGHTDWVYAVALTGDGTGAVTASLDHTARHWDLATAVPLQVLTLPSLLACLGMTQQGARIVVIRGEQSGAVSVFTAQGIPPAAAKSARRY